MQQIQREIDDLISGMESSDRDLRDKARRAIIERRDRLTVIGDDIAGWNAVAADDTRRAAGELVQEIDRLGSACAEICLIVALHEEHIRLFLDTSNLPDDRRRILKGPPTLTQQQVMQDAAEADDAPISPTRAQAWSWIDSQARFHRSWTDSDGWFVWIDPEGHTHRLSGPFAIERRLVATFRKLEGMREDLSRSETIEALYMIVERAIASLERMTSLKADLERFDRDADSRDLAACKTYASYWRSKRNTS
ncbi:hypothetical protein [Sphingobium sp. ZW T5_29]|uniref:hypothetical protein n=1 Tax=Sphingobium sp. ZW T5_29 TaxID=3378077 RepID=UPI0038522757